MTEIVPSPGKKAMTPSPWVDEQERDCLGGHNERALGAAVEEHVAHQIGTASLIQTLSAHPATRTSRAPNFITSCSVAPEIREGSSGPKDLVIFRNTPLVQCVERLFDLRLLGNTGLGAELEHLLDCIQCCVINPFGKGHVEQPAGG